MAEDITTLDTPTTPTDEFFSVIQIPFNEDWRENGYEFVNAVSVAEIFIKATSYAAGLAERAENLTDKIANLEYQRGRRERDLLRTRRTIFSEKFSEITKSAGPEIQNAFLLAKADEGQRAQLLSIEADLDKFDDDIGRLKPRLDKVRGRMKLLERNMDWAKQWLDYDKLMHRMLQTART